MVPEDSRPFQFRLRTLFLLIAAVALGLWLVGNARIAHWSGRFHVTLRVQSRSSRIIKRISYATFHKREIAEVVAKRSSGPPDVSFDPVIEDEGRILARIRCGGKSNQFGQELSYYAERYVVLRIQYAGGREHRTVLVVPRGRGPRSVKVTVP